ncbi:MAG: hypothetical protein Q8928_04445 [Bacteroidota bacterium]|nr:hypothetical protein [Bacteroidota bacterium]
MIRKLVILSLAILTSFSLFSQNLERWRAGSALSLGGKVYILSVFVTTPKEKWTYDDKIKLISRQILAQDWLVKQAKEYGVQLSFLNGFYGVKTDMVVDEIISNKEHEGRVDWVNYILTKAGYKSPADFQERLKNTYSDCDNSLVIIYANTKGRSYAVPFHTGMNKNKYFVEGCCVYRYYKGVELLPATIAHEILHLFGAWDLYKDGAKTLERANRAWELFPHDVMREGSYDINNLKIDRLTAWLVGLTPYKESTFDWFNPAGIPGD